jgi:hypothetical protein
MQTASQPAKREASVIGRARSLRGEPLKIFDDVIYIKLGGQETDGRYALLEDVTFYVLEGDYLFEADGKRFEAHTGDFVFVPRDIPHRFRNIGKTNGTLLLTLEPAGLEIFFEELAAVPGPPEPAKLIPLFEKYGLELLGPPLGDD